MKNRDELPTTLYSCQQVKALDNFALGQYHLTAYELMERAARCAFNLLVERWPEIKHIGVICGTGNNGGDGLVLARLARSHGLKVTVCQVGEVEEARLTSEARQARQDYGVSTIVPFKGTLPPAELWVDAILGTGANKPLSPSFQQAIEAINQSQRPILALDLPSGLNGDTGTSLGIIVKATATITFIALKAGLYGTEAANGVGELCFASLVENLNTSSIIPLATRLRYQDVIAFLPPRQATAHKGTHGHVVVIGGGQANFSGALCLSGSAALRSGAGLVSLICAPESLSLLSRGPAELMCYAPTEVNEISALLAKATTLVIGPGLAQTSWSEQFFNAALNLPQPKIVDADALNLLAKQPRHEQNWILTPHPGEAARLLNKSIAWVQQDRLQAARLLQQQYGGIIILKGVGTVIAAPNEQFYINGGAYPGLATGGTGDVLAGMLGALVAQGIPLRQAACLAVKVHTEAASLAQHTGIRGLIASDLLLPIRQLLNPLTGNPTW